MVESGIFGAAASQEDGGVVDALAVRIAEQGTNRGIRELREGAEDVDGYPLGHAVAGRLAAAVFGELLERDAVVLGNAGQDFYWTYRCVQIPCPNGSWTAELQELGQDGLTIENLVGV